MKNLRRIYRKIRFLLSINWLKTIYLNFLEFPLNIAIKLPIYVFYKVELIGLKRGCIKFADNITIKPGIVHLGTKQWPIMPNGGQYTLLRFERNSSLILGSDLKFKTGCTLCIYKNATLKIGNDFWINSSSRIYCKKKIVIGNHCRIGWETQLYDTDFHFIYNEKKKSIGALAGCIELGDNVWITNRCTIAKNVTIPSFSIVASGSIVNKDLSHITSKGNLFVGRPAELKATGVFRIVNEKAQSSLQKEFQEADTDKLYIEEGLHEEWLSN